MWLGSSHFPLCLRPHQIQSFLAETNIVLSASEVLFASETLNTLTSKYDFTPLLNQAKQLANNRVRGLLCATDVCG